MTRALNRTYDFVDVDRFPGTVALADLHLWGGFVHRKIRSNFGESCLQDRHMEPLRRRAGCEIDGERRQMQLAITQPSPRSACAFMPAGIPHGRSSDSQASY